MIVVSVDCYWYKCIILDALAWKDQGNEAGNASKCFFNMRLSPILIRAKRQSWRMKVKYARVRVREPTSLVANSSEASAVFWVLYYAIMPLVLFLSTYNPLFFLPLKICEDRNISWQTLCVGPQMPSKVSRNRPL